MKSYENPVLIKRAKEIAQSLTFTIELHSHNTGVDDNEVREFIEMDLLFNKTIEDMENKYKEYLENNAPLLSGWCRVDRVCYHCGQRLYNMQLIKGVISFQSWDKKINDFIPLSPCELTELKPFVIELDIPSGKMLFANGIRCLSEKVWAAHKELQYTTEYSINYVAGRLACMKLYETYNYGEFNIGNCGCKMYAGPGVDEFAVGYFYDDEEQEHQILPDGYKEVGDVVTDFWGFGIADYDHALNNGFKTDSRNYNVIPCKPGRYRFIHQYHMDPDAEIYTRIQRIG